MIITQDNWNHYIKDFSPNEYSEDPIKYANPTFLIHQQKLRNIVDNRIFPSPVSGALARFSGSSKSEHYVGNKDEIVRQSGANDVFIEGNPLMNWSLILSSQLFNGVGIYLDTEYNHRPWPLIHLDIREKGYKGGTLIWMRDNNSEYLYPQLYSLDRRKFTNHFQNSIILKEWIYKQ